MMAKLKSKFSVNIIQTPQNQLTKIAFGDKIIKQSAKIPAGLSLKFE